MGSVRTLYPVKRLLCGLLTLALLLGLLPYLSDPVRGATGYDRGYSGGMAGHGTLYAHGLDVSYWQDGKANFQSFANAGYDFVILRCGTSVGKDKNFDAYYNSAKAAGLDVGCYFYSYATNTSEAVTDANKMLSWMGDKKFEYPVYLDYEDPSQSSTLGTAAAQICYAFLDLVASKGYLVGLYSMHEWMDLNFITTSGLRSKYEGWAAHVPNMNANTGITSNVYKTLESQYSTRYGMLQYSHSTYVNGVGPFDADVAYKDYPAIVKKYGFNGYSAGSWIEDACFDVMVYRDRNKDLAGMTDAQLKEHWLSHGIREGRASSTILDLEYYKLNNPDLAYLGNDYTAYYQHFITEGYKQRRKSSMLFDGDYYLTNNPDVAASEGDNYLNHYIQIGMKEGRRASKTYSPDYYLFVRPDVAEVWPNDYVMAARHYAGHGINANVVAYDWEEPVISDITVTQISAEGYTVSCTVLDNWKIDKVSFPTWTVENDQDDLADFWHDTQQGVCQGNTYTFRVNASDHNGETGLYITHIYAWDQEGNHTSAIVEKVTVEDPVEPDPVPTEPQQITPMPTSGYLREGSLLMNVPAGLMVHQLLEGMENQNLDFLDANGDKLSGAAPVGTGMVINLLKDGKRLDSVTVIVAGDVDGSGDVDPTDYMLIKSVWMGQRKFGVLETSAADVDDSGTVDVTDYMRIKSYFLGTYDLITKTTA